MSAPQITPLTTTPDPKNGRATFDQDMATRLAEDVARIAEANTQADFVNTKATEVLANSEAVETAKTEAEAASSAAVALAGASAHVPNAAYAPGDPVWSNVDFQTYRAKTTHVDVASDPSADTANWVELSSGSAIEEAQTRARLHSLWTGA